MQIRYKKRLLTFFLSSITLFALSKAYFLLTDDFHIYNIISCLSDRYEWNIPPLNENEKNKINTILNQTFHYIGKGAQSYALESEDGNYVLKLFKSKHLKPSFFLKIQPDNRFKKSRLLKKENKLASVLKGYHLAYKIHRKESGLLFIHLNSQFPLNRTLKIVDKLGLKWNLDADSAVFVIQKKAIKFRSLMNELLQKGEISLAKEKIRRVIQLYLNEYQKGIYDHDHGVMHNIGFTDDEPIRFDVGKLYKDPQILNPKLYLSDLEKVLVKIRNWTKTEYPLYYDEIALETHLTQKWGK